MVKTRQNNKLRRASVVEETIKVKGKSPRTPITRGAAKAAATKLPRGGQSETKRDSRKGAGQRERETTAGPSEPWEATQGKNPTLALPSGSSPHER